MRVTLTLSCIGQTRRRNRLADGQSLSAYRSAGDDGGDEAKRALAGALIQVSNCYVNTRRSAEGLAAATEALTILEHLDLRAERKFVLARAYDCLATAYAVKGRSAEAATAAEQSLAAWREVAAANPNFRLELAASLENLAARHRRAGHYAEALVVFEAAVTALQAYASDPDFSYRLTDALEELPDDQGLASLPDKLVLAPDEVLARHPLQADTSTESAVWHLYHGHRLVAELSMEFIDQPWFYATFEPTDEFAAWRATFARLSNPEDPNFDPTDPGWAEAQDRINHAPTLYAPNGRAVEEFLMYTDGDFAEWRWHAPFTNWHDIDSD